MIGLMIGLMIKAICRPAPNARPAGKEIILTLKGLALTQLPQLK